MKFFLNKNVRAVETRQKMASFYRRITYRWRDRNRIILFLQMHVAGSVVKLCAIRTYFFFICFMSWYEGERF